MNSKYKGRCPLRTVFGHSLRKGVIITGLATTLISITALITSAVFLGGLSDISPLNKHPVAAVNLLFALFGLFISVYQIVISLILSYGTHRTKGDRFLCWLWYVSQVTIMIFCGMFFIAKSVICFSNKEIVLSVFTVIIGAFLEGLFTYFIIIVDSFLNTLEADIFY